MFHRERIEGAFGQVASTDGMEIDRMEESSHEVHTLPLFLRGLAIAKMVRMFKRISSLTVFGWVTLCKEAAKAIEE